jgi:threonine 3-dehydrogenase
MAEKMRALLKKKPGPGLEMDLVDIPHPGPNEILVKVRATSICGTDVHIYKWDAWAQSRIKPPLIIGHEFCGEVVEVGKEVKSIKVGDFISAESHIPDYTCPVCRKGQPHICQNLKILGVDTNGSFAEYVVIPEICAWKSDPNLDPAIASIQEPLGNAVYAVLAEPISGKTVAVFGDGPAGNNAVAVAKAAGAGTIFQIGKHRSRLEIGRKMGADFSINVAEGQDPVKIILEKTEGVGVDVVLEMAGSQQALEQGFAVLRKGGRFTAFGIPSDKVSLDWANALIFKGAHVIGINGRLMWETWYQMAELLKSGKLDPSPIITHKIPLDNFEEGFRLLTSPERDVGKVVMFP